MTKTCIWDVHGSNLGLDTGFPEWIPVILLNWSNPVYLKLDRERLPTLSHEDR
jgi:hypothetical protein